MSDSTNQSDKNAEASDQQKLLDNAYKTMLNLMEEESDLNADSALRSNLDLDSIADSFGHPFAQGLSDGGQNLSGILSQIVGLWSQQIKFWQDIVETTVARTAPESASSSPSPDFSNQDLFKTDPDMQLSCGLVIVCNRQDVTAEVNWKAHVPDVALTAQAPALVGKSKASTGLALDFLLSLDKETQVLNLTIDAKVPAGNYVGIIFDDQGADHGYYRISVPEKST